MSVCGPAATADIDPDDTTNDSEGDGFNDAYEILYGSDPDDPNQIPTLGDINGDGCP